MINKGLIFNTVILKLYRFVLEKNSLMVKQVCVFKVTEYSYWTKKCLVLYIYMAIATGIQ